MSGIGFGDGQSAKKSSSSGRKKSNKKTARLKIIARELLKGASVTEAGLAAGFAKSTAINLTEKVIKPNAEEFQRILEHCLPDDLLMLKARQGLEATVVKTASMDGEITDIQEFADFQTRHKYLETALQLKGHLRNGGINVNSDKTVIFTLRRIGAGDSSST